MTSHRDWCAGCALPPQKRVNLPADWKPGNEVPKDVTWHSTEREPQTFAFVGDPCHQIRAYFKNGEYDFTS